MAAITGELESDIAPDGKAAAVSADAAEKQAAEPEQGGEADRERQEARSALGSQGESVDEGSNPDEGVASGTNSPPKDDNDEDYVPSPSQEDEEDDDDDDDEDDGGGDDESGEKREHGKGESSDSARTPSRGKKSGDGGDSGSNSSDAEMMESNTVTGSVLRDIVASPSKRGDDDDVEVDTHVVQNLFQIDDRSGAIGEEIGSLFPRSYLTLSDKSLTHPAYLINILMHRCKANDEGRCQQCIHIFEHRYNLSVF